MTDLASVSVGDRYRLRCLDAPRTIEVTGLRRRKPQGDRYAHYGRRVDWVVLDGPPSGPNAVLFEVDLLESPNAERCS